jgi:hypothetical protein
VGAGVTVIISCSPGERRQFIRIVEKSDVLNRLEDRAHLRIRQGDVRRDGSVRLAAKVLRKDTVERIKPLPQAASDFKSKAEIGSLRRNVVSIRRIEQ